MSWLCQDCLTDMPNMIETATGMFLDLGFLLVQFLLKLDGEEVSGLPALPYFDPLSFQLNSTLTLS